jgi:hypothetical protein
MKILIYVKKIQIIEHEFGTDKVLLFTDLPSPYPVGVGNNQLIMEFNTERRGGIDYVKQNFMHDVEFPKNAIVEHINIKTGRHKIIS